MIISLEDIREFDLIHILAENEKENRFGVPFVFKDKKDSKRKIYAVVQDAIGDMISENLIPYEVYFHQTPGKFRGQNRGTETLSWEKFERLGKPLKMKSSYILENMD